MEEKETASDDSSSEASLDQEQGNTNPVISLMDLMKDGREFESLIRLKQINVNVSADLKRALSEIQAIRKRPIICYASNVINTSIKSSISIDNSDDLPFSEMIRSIPADQREVDIILITPGGSGTQVAKFVDKLRPRFDKVSFILPNIAMSAGTIFVMSGDEIIMTSDAYIGPIDPQVPNKQGNFVPAQALMTLIEEIRKRGQELLNKGQKPLWTDLHLLHNIDHKEIGNAISASNYSIDLVKDYLFTYKFKTWDTHRDGTQVTEEEKLDRADEIAKLLCNHSEWKSHSRGITREKAWEVCKIKITHSESIPELDRSLRRLWALLYWYFHKTTTYKLFVSDNYIMGLMDSSKQ